MSLIPVPQSPEPTPAELSASAVVDGVNGEHAHDIMVMKNLWETLWENHRATPVEIFSVLGPRGYLVLQAGAAQIAHLQASAQLAGTNLEEILGDAKYLTTKYPVTLNGDGSVNVEMP